MPFTVLRSKFFFHRHLQKIKIKNFIFVPIILTFVTQSKSKTIITRSMCLLSLIVFTDTIHGQVFMLKMAISSYCRNIKINIIENRHFTLAYLLGETRLSFIRSTEQELSIYVTDFTIWNLYTLFKTSCSEIIMVQKTNISGLGKAGGLPRVVF